MNLTFSHLIAAISTDKSSVELLVHDRTAHESQSLRKTYCNNPKFLAREFDVYYLRQTIIGKVRVRYRPPQLPLLRHSLLPNLFICYYNNNVLLGDRITTEYQLLGLYMHALIWCCFKTFSLLVGVDQSLGACYCVRGHQQARWHLLT